MDECTAKGFNRQPSEKDGPCTKPFLLCELVEGQKDKLGHKVEEILWIGQRYAIYRSQKGVYVQFSDCVAEEAAQRNRFTEISPELCELRYLTSEMRSRWFSAIGSKGGQHASYLYDHNIAQSLMLVMEDRVSQGQALAKQTLKMVVQRVTNDNTVVYFACCVAFWIACVFVGATALLILHYYPWPELLPFVAAAAFGATGAMLSVATRLRAFELQPCQQSSMNYLMSITRIGIGFIAGPVLLLLLSSAIVSEPMRALIPATGEWRGAAVLGLIGGFAERLIPNLLRRTLSQVEAPAGTPVQAVRNETLS